MSDDTNTLFQLVNWTATDNQFVPLLLSQVSTNVATNLPALVIRADIPIASDTGGTAVIMFEARAVGADIASRTPFEWRNRNTSLMTLNATSRLTLMHQDEGGIERLLDISLTDAAGSYFRIENNLGGVAGDYAPMLRGHRAFADNAFGGLYIQGSINSGTEDTGSQAVVTIDARAGTGTALVTRPMLVIRNAASIRYTFGVTAMTFTDTMNIAFSTGTGTKIGTGTTQKIGFWNATPVVQPSAIPDTSSGVVATVEAEVNKIKALLRSVGFMP